MRDSFIEVEFIYLTSEEFVPHRGGRIKSLIFIEEKELF